MRKYQVYHHPSEGMLAVRDGFCLPAFLLSFLWIIFKKLWFHVLAWAYWIFLAVFLYLDLYEKLAGTAYAYVFWAGVFAVFFLWPGFSGNRWLQSKIKKQGFEYLEAVRAKNKAQAIQVAADKKRKWTVPAWSRGDDFDEEQEELLQPAALTITREKKTAAGPGAWIAPGLLILAGLAWMFMDFSWFAGDEHPDQGQVQSPEVSEQSAENEASSPGSERNVSPSSEDDPAPGGRGQEAGSMPDQGHDRVAKAEDLSAAPDWAVKCDQDVKAQNWDQAVSSCSKASRAEPDNPELWNNLGRAHMQAGEDRQAEQAYARAVQIDPDNAQAWSGRAEALSSQGQAARAAQAYSEVVRIEPENMTVRAKLAQEYSRSGQTGKAVDVWQEADAVQPGSGLEGLKAMARNEPDNPELWQELGKSSENLQDWEGAAQAYSQVLDIDPQKAEAWASMGKAQMEMGRFQEAVSAYDTATGINPGLADSWYGKGRAYLKDRDVSDQGAFSRPSRVYVFFHEELDVWHGFELADAGLVPRLEAARAFSRAVSLDSGYAQAWYEMGSFFLAVGEWAKPAVIYLEKAAGLRPGDVEIWKDLARAYQSAGDWDQTIGALEKIIRLQPGKVENWQELIRIFEDQGQEDKVKELTLEMDRFVMSGPKPGEELRTNDNLP